MKKLTAAVIALAISCSLFSQKNKDKNSDLPDFGTVDKADLEMKKCDFDDKAEAEVLIDDGMLEWTGQNLQFKRRIRIKILNSKGLDWANVHLSYKSERGEQDIKSLEAKTYNLDANGNVIATPIDSKSIYEKKLNKKYSEKVFSFAEAKVGSIIEYRYKKTNMGLIDWYFQRSIPVRYSHFTLDLPNELVLATIPYCNHEFQKDKQDKSTESITTYSMKNVPALRDEPFIFNQDYYCDRIETKVTAFYADGRRINRVITWVDVIKYLMDDEDFGMQLKKNIPRTADLDEKLKMIKNPYDKMKTIYKYVQDNMTWNEYDGIWAFDGVKSAWKDKKGTVGEINLILVNLLKDAELDAYPVLVSTRENGVVNTLDAGTYESPGFLQFDKVMAYVNIDDKKYVLDATEKNMPAHLIPTDVLLTQGLVIGKLENFEWGWKDLWNDGMQSKNIILIKGDIDEKGKMSGFVNINSYDYARQARYDVVKKGKDKFIESYIKASNPNLSVDSVSFENLESDSLPLIQKISFNQQLNATGEYNYFSANMLTGLEKNPFVADERSSDVFFGFNQSYTIMGTYSIPDGYEFSELPKNVKMIMPDTSISISRVSQVNDNMLQLKIQLDFNKPIYSAEHYAEMHEFYQRLFDLLNEQYVFKKKK